MIEPSKQLQKIFDSSVEITKSYNHRLITLEHLIFAIVADKESSAGLKEYGADVDYIKSNLDHYLKNNLKDIESTDKTLPRKTNSVERVLNRCFTQVLFSGRNQMEIADVIVSVLSEKNSFAFYFLTKGGIIKEKFVQHFQKHYIEEDEFFENESGSGPLTNDQLDKIVNQFCDNLSLKAKQKTIDPVIGRDLELEDIELVLARRTKSNVLMVGDPGVGKTAIAEGLARKIHEKKVPKFIQDHTVYTLDIDSLVAG